MKNFFDAITNAVEEWYVPGLTTVSLSSGTDSGVIAAALHKLNKKFKIVSMTGNEDLDILKARHKFLKQKASVIGPYSQKDINNIQEEMTRAGYSLGKETGIGIATGHYFLAKHCSPILLSGIGADEYYTNNIRRMVDFLTFSDQAYSFHKINMRSPLLNVNIVKELGCLDPEYKLKYKKAFGMYIKDVGLPYTPKKINFEVLQNNNKSYRKK
tara:strand:+ start:5889 stop:6527 length:639 start_codon:yes stop_codon:yes gene_type:complete